MHMDTFGLKIIASDKVFYEGRCRKLILPAPDGEIGILANHENAVIALGVGDARLEYKEDQWMEIALGEGFAEVINNRVTVLVSTAERPDEIDIHRAEEAKERAEERLRQKQSTQEYYQTQAALARAMNRLKISQRKK
ncbi:ATP synthase F1 subunit epsilon [Clostridium sp. C105KSO13]|uniref:ATP synthase F1 subunit epsilon n=1 Tax=Clostridium sp. C105KSO13 TaxID=1776045 RepID=UPI00325C036A